MKNRPVDYEHDETRWVTERTRFLGSNEVGLDEPVAEAVVWSELGYSVSGTAKQMGVTEATVKGYRVKVSEVYPGILVRVVTDFDGRIDVGIDDLPSSPDRTCPACGMDRLCGVEEAKKVFRVNKRWGAISMLDSADLCCSYCRLVRIDGEWRRMQKVEHRARQLAESSDRHGYDHYVGKLQSGRLDL